MKVLFLAFDMQSKHLNKSRTEKVLGILEEFGICLGSSFKNVGNTRFPLVDLSLWILRRAPKSISLEAL